jgi:hypothetical protein
MSKSASNYKLIIDRGNRVPIFDHISNFTLSILTKICLPTFFMFMCICMTYSCESQSQVYQACQTDDDCRDGYECNQDQFKGECVQRQTVVACGESFCMYPREVCKNLMCVAADTMNEVAGTELVAGEMAGEMAGAMADTMANTMAGVTSGQTAGDIAGEFAGENNNALGPLEIMLDTPSNQQLFSPNTDILVQGHIRQEGQNNWDRLQMTLEVIPLNAINSMFTQDLLISSQASFEATINLDIGVYDIRIYARGVSDEAWIKTQIRVDTFVRVNQLNLVHHEDRYRYVAIHMPDLLPQLSNVDTSRRSLFLKERFQQLRESGVQVLRIFAGWTDTEWGVWTENKELNPVGIALLDEIVSQASMQELKVIMVLADMNGDHDGISKYLQWHGFQTPTSIDQTWMYQVGIARSHVQALMQALPQHTNQINGISYAQDPGILGWEILHVPNWRIFEPRNPEIITDFLASSLSILKEVTPQQLHWTGELGLDYNSTPYGMHQQVLNQYQLTHLLDGSWGGSWELNARQLSHSLQSIVLDPWLFFEDTNDPNRSSSDWIYVGQAWIRAHALANITFNKPLSAQLIRIAHHTLTLEQQRSLWIAWAQEMRSQGLVGMTIGDIRIDGIIPAYTSNLDAQYYVYVLSDPNTLALIQSISQTFLGSMP